MTSDGLLLCLSLGAREQSTEPPLTVCFILLGMHLAGCMVDPGPLSGLTFGPLAWDGSTFFQNQF